jgi:hypothetical protein
MDEQRHEIEDGALLVRDNRLIGLVGLDEVNPPALRLEGK